MMNLALNTLPRGRSEQIFDSIAQLQKDESIDWEPLQLKVELGVDRQGQNFYLHARVRCKGRFTCEAGMELFEDELHGEFKTLLTFDPRYTEDNEEAEEIIHIPAHEPDFDLYPLVRDAILLAIPISHVCGDDCPEGQALMEGLREKAEPDERWAKLKDMFKE